MIQSKTALLIFEGTTDDKSRKFGKSTGFIQKNHKIEYSLQASSKNVKLQVES